MVEYYHKNHCFNCKFYESISYGHSDYGYECKFGFTWRVDLRCPDAHIITASKADRKYKASWVEVDGERLLKIVEVTNDMA